MKILTVALNAGKSVKTNRLPCDDEKNSGYVKVESYYLKESAAFQRLCLLLTQPEVISETKRVGHDSVSSPRYFCSGQVVVKFITACVCLHVSRKRLELLAIFSYY